MENGKRVFVGILWVWGTLGIVRVEVSTSFRGICRVFDLVKKDYGKVAKRWGRREKGVSRLAVEIDTDGVVLIIEECKLDMIWNRGDKEVAEKMAKRAAENRSAGGTGFRGMKGGDGRLHPAKREKLMLGDEPVNTWKEGDPE